MATLKEYRVEKVFDIVYTGGNISIAYGKMKNGLYFSLGCDNIFFYNENEFIVDNNEIDLYEWENEHQVIIKDFSEKDFNEIIKQVYKLYKGKDKKNIDIFYLNNEILKK